MNAITAPKSSAQNRLEGFALTATFQGLPIFADAGLMLKLIGAHAIVSERGGAAIFVVLAALFYSAITPWLGARFQKFRSAYEPLFFDAGLSLSDKIAQWRTQPRVSLQLLTTTMILSVLAVAVVSMG